MLMKLGKVLFAVAVASVASNAHAGFRYVYSPQYAGGYYPAAYGAYSPAYAGYAPAYAGYAPSYAGYTPAYAASYSPFVPAYAGYSPAAAAFNPALAASAPHYATLANAAAAKGHVAVPTAAADGTTPSVAAYSPLGNFLGWWQLINGVVTFVDGATGGGGGGGGAVGTGVTSTQFQGFVDKYNKDMEDIKVALKSKGGGAGPGTGDGEVVGGGAGGGGGVGAGGGAGTVTVPPPAAAAAPAAPVAVPVITGTAVERVDKIIDKTSKIKFKK